MIRKPLYESVDLQPKYYVSDDVLRILNIILDFAKQNKDKPLEKIYLEAYHQCVNQMKKVELNYGYITLNELSEGDIIDFVSSIDDDLDDAITTGEEGEYFTNIKIGAVSKRLEPLKEFEVLDFMGDIYNGEDGDIESASNGNGLLRNNLNKLVRIIEADDNDMDESSQRRHHKHHITEKRTQLYRKSENKNKKSYKLENILVPEKRSFRRKDLNDRLMLGSIMHPDYQTALSNGKYFYATKEDIFDFIADTGLQTIYTAKLPKDAADNMFRYTSDGRSNPIRLNKLDITINGNKFDVTDNDGETLTGDTKDLKTLKSLFVNTPKNIQTFFVPYQHMFFLCLQADGEFGVMMVEYK